MHFPIPGRHREGRSPAYGRGTCTTVVPGLDYAHLYQCLDVRSTNPQLFKYFIVNTSQIYSKRAETSIAIWGLSKDLLKVRFPHLTWNAGRTSSIQRCN